MAARDCAAGTGAVPWSRAVGAASARVDGVGRDAALSWKLTAVMEQTTTEVTFLTSSIIFHLFSSLSYHFHPCLSDRLSIVLRCHLFLLLKKNLPHCSSASSLHAVPVLLVIIIFNMYVFVQARVCAQTFLSVYFSFYFFSLSYHS